MTACSRSFATVPRWRGCGSGSDMRPTGPPTCRSSSGGSRCTCSIGSGSLRPGAGPGRRAAHPHVERGEVPEGGQEMSRVTMAAAAATLPRAPIYGIGTYAIGSSVADFEIGWDELDRDTEWAHSDAVRGRHQRGTSSSSALRTTRIRGSPHRSRASPHRGAVRHGRDLRLGRPPILHVPAPAAGQGDRRHERRDGRRADGHRGHPADTAVRCRRRLGTRGRTPPAKALGIPAAAYLPLGPALGLGNARGTRRTRQCRGMGSLEPEVAFR